MVMVVFLDGLGKEPPKVEEEFGTIMFKYTGDPCNDTDDYSVNIKMICDFTVKDGNDGIALYPPVSLSFIIVHV